jgi:hypothetical protein
MGKKIAFLQIRLLQLLGFLSLTTEKGRVFAHFRNVSVVCFLLGSWTCCGLEFTRSLATIFENNQRGLLVKVLRNLPSCVIILRPVLVLSLTLFKRSSSKNLLQVINKFSETSLSAASIDRSSLRTLWRRNSIAALTITATIMITWYFWKIKVSVLRNLEVSLFDDDAMLPLPIKMQVWQYATFLLIFMVVSFIFSQQVFLILLFSASILGKALKSVNCSIRETTAQFIEYPEVISWAELEERLVHWRAVYSDARNLCDELNRYFSLILFVIYSLDFFSLLGFGAMILVIVKALLERYMFFMSSAMMFTLHITVFLIPLISAHEQVSFLKAAEFVLRTEYFFQSLEIGDNLQCLIDVNEQRLLESAEV